MKPLLILAVCATLAVAQQGNSVRLGNPLAAPSPNIVSVATDADQPLPRASSANTPVLDAELPKMYFDAGEPVVLTTYLHTKDGRALDDGDVQVDDQVDSTAKPRRFGLAVGKGKQRVTLDNQPGEHHLIVATPSGHRAAKHFYVVATGELQVTDVGKVRTEGGALVVPLTVKVAQRQQPGDFTFSAVLATETTAVARAEVLVYLPAGTATVELRFQQSDIVEPGPYHLVNVMVNGSNESGPMLAAAPHDLHRRFQGPHTGKEPPPVVNEDGMQVWPPRVFDPPAPVGVPARPLMPGDDAVGEDPNPITPPEQ